MAKTLMIETGNGVYEIRKPVGPIGAKHIALLSQVVVAGPEEEPTPEMVREVAPQLAQVFETWAQEVLPQLIVQGPYTYEEMPAEDQYAVFLALVSDLKVSKNYFRVVG